MEKSTPVGLFAGLALIFGSIFLGDGWLTFFDIPSFVIVVGGTAAATMVTFTFAELRRFPGIVKEFFAFRSPDLGQYVDEFQELARTARRDGLLALDRRLADLRDPYARYGLEMAVDGMDENEIRSLMQERATSTLTHLQLGSRVMTNAGSYAPAFGMIGTLIGLIQMLQNLEDPSQIGAGMAVALITTFYGALLANLVFLPIAVKMKAQLKEIQRAQQMVQVGVLGIVQGESPSMIEKRLLLYLDEEVAGGRMPQEASPLSKAA